MLRDEVAGGELEDEPAVHLLLEVDVEGVEGLARIAEAGLFSGVHLWPVLGVHRGGRAYARRAVADTRRGAARSVRVHSGKRQSYICLGHHSVVANEDSRIMQRGVSPRISVFLGGVVLLVALLLLASIFISWMHETWGTGQNQFTPYGF